jgi:prepilin signal peptidase PulO-like enzyme (type II secretory pathway)
MLANLLLLLVLGLVVGSFLGVLVLRLPRHEPVILARSACPHCGHELTAAELIPVISWLIQRRRCRTCSVKLSGFYPAIELASAAIAVASGWLFSGVWIAAGCLIGWIILALVAWRLSNSGSHVRL